MELKEFIKQTIIDITDGLIEGQKYIKDNNLGEGIESGYKRIQFDIAVTSQDENKIGGGGKVTVANIFSVKGEAENVTAITNVSRIQFNTLIAIKTT